VDGEAGARLRGIHGASASGGTAAGIADGVVEEMSEWSSGPLDPVCAAVSVDAVAVRARIGTAGNNNENRQLHTQ
jgi:hypothetical protein